MKINYTSEELEVIEAYIRNEAVRSELIDFEKKLKNNPQFHVKVKEISLMQLAIAEVGLEIKLNDFHAEHNLTNKHKNRKNNHLKSSAIAASIVILIGLAFFFFLHQKEQSLYSKFYKSDPGLMTTMNYSDHYDFQKAMVDYKSGEYHSAIPIWKNQLDAAPQNDTLNYFLGAAYQAKGNLDSAGFYLEQVVSSPQSAFYGDANWYLGLIYLQQNQKEKAIGNLKKSNHAKKENLIRLLEKQ